MNLKALLKDEKKVIWLIVLAGGGIALYLYKRQSQSVPPLPLSLQQSGLLVSALTPPQPINTDAS